MSPSVDFLTTPDAIKCSSTIDQQYWNANLPPNRWTKECPNFLLGLGPKNIEILSSKQEDFHTSSWEDAKDIIASNRIDQFQRAPIELRRYIHYMYHLKQRYGSVLSFIQQERLRWESVCPSGKVPFEDPTDLKVLYNDWPYGIDPDITHLVVWVKFLLEDDPETGFLTSEHRELVNNFVQKTFCGRGGLRSDQVLWFKNWKSLKSVHALEHFHVMLYKVPVEFLDEITHHDKPMCEVVSEL